MFVNCTSAKVEESESPNNMTKRRDNRNERMWRASHGGPADAGTSGQSQEARGSSAESPRMDSGPGDKGGTAGRGGRLQKAWRHVCLTTGRAAALTFESNKGARGTGPGQAGSQMVKGLSPPGSRDP